MKLILRSTGGAELLDDNDQQLWTSDADGEFQEQFPDILTEDDVDDVLDYLVDEAGVISEEHADSDDFEFFEEYEDSEESDETEDFDNSDESVN